MRLARGVFRALIVTYAAAGAPRCSDVLPLDAFDDCLVAAASRPLCESPTALCVSAAGVGTVFFKHLRKAGGTTMRSYLTGRVCQARFPARRGCGGSDASAIAAANISLWAEELSILHPKYYPMRGAAAPSNSLMLVTTLREPVSRALSLQRFEGCGVTTAGQMRKGVPPPPDDCARNVSSWATFLMAKFAALANHPRHPANMWDEVSNYYTQVFAGAMTRRAAESDYRQAARALAAFDLVLLLEELTHADTAAALRAAFSTPSVAGCGAALAGFRTVMPAGGKREQALMRETRDTRASAADLALLAELNAWDVRLYELARRLQSAQLARWREREQGGGAQRCAPPAGACDPPIGKDDRMERGGFQGGMQLAPTTGARRGKAGLCE